MIARRRGGPPRGSGGRETVRAVLIFASLAATLVGIAVHLSYRELHLQVRARQLERARAEALRFSDVVLAVGREPGGVDFSRLRRSPQAVERAIRDELRKRSLVREVEVRDRFGMRILSVVTPRPDPSLVVTPRVAGPPEDEIQVPPLVAQFVRGPHREGEVRVLISDEAYRRELDRLRAAYAFKVRVAAACGVGVLVLGLTYVMFLIRKNRRLEQSRRSAERRSYVGLLASGLAHEIRNPLNAMNMNLQMLEEEIHGSAGFDADHSEMLESTKNEIKRLERLVNNFLAYARPAEPRFEPAGLNRIVQEVARFLQADFRQSGVTLALDLERMLPTVEVDETQLKQALMNLLVNARQVLRDRGVVRVRTRMGAAGEAVVEICDDGPGMSQEVQERVFEVFYSSRGGGTGLGLPIARQIVERHGGSLSVDSREGRGTTFVIRLPRRHPGASGGRPAPERPA